MIGTNTAACPNHCSQKAEHTALSSSFWGDGRGYLFNINMQYWPFVLVCYTQQPGSCFLLKVHQEESERWYFHKSLSQHVVWFWFFFHLLNSPLVSVLCDMQGQLWWVWCLYLYLTKQYIWCRLTEITANPISVLCNSFPCQAAAFRSKALEGARSFWW